MVARASGKQALKREASREAILDAAEELFLSNGFHGARVEDIASKANLTKGAVYFHFEDKESVLMEVLHRVRAIVLKPLIEAMGLDGMSPSDKIIAFLHRQAAIANEYPQKLLMTILLSIELNGTHSVPAQYVKGGYARLAVELEKVIAAGQEAGDFRRDLRARELASVLLALNDGMMLEWMRRQHRLDGAEFVRAMRTVLWVGMSRHHAKDEVPALLYGGIRTIARV